MDVTESAPSPDAKRMIFVGSSHEGLHNEAERVCAALRKCDNSIEPRLWTDFFEAGSLTFEALEEMLLKCCGAVFVFRPDDVVRHISQTPPLNDRVEADPLPTGDARHISSVQRHTRSVHMPRGNVLLEFGLVAGRMGRRNVAVCRFDKAELPTDLASMTVIDADCIKSDVEHSGQGLFRDESQERLRSWAARLLSTAGRIPRTALFHGYTGQWDFQLRLDKWHSVLLKDSGYAVMNGSLNLFISPDGDSGHGFAHGVLSYHLEIANSSGAQSDRYTGDLQVIHEIKDVDCKTDGSLGLVSHMSGVYPINADSTQWPELQRYLRTEPWTFTWELAQKGARELIGTVKTNASGGTEGHLIAKKKKLC